MYFMSTNYHFACGIWSKPGTTTITFTRVKILTSEITAGNSVHFLARKIVVKMTILNRYCNYATI